MFGPMKFANFVVMARKPLARWKDSASAFVPAVAAAASVDPVSHNV